MRYNVEKPKYRFGKKELKIILIVLLVVGILYGSVTAVGIIGTNANRKFITNSVTAVEYENQLVPTLDENGYYTFTTDEEFRFMQLTDIHIGAGFLCLKKDSMALNAVAAMIAEEKPDLVIVTGDIAYPIPVQAGTINNERPAVLFAQLMEKLGVYWCLTFGNHDTEDYAYYTREEIAEIYMDREKYPHCLLQAGPEDVDGTGNYVINVKNTKGEITQSLFMVDSQMYISSYILGLISTYDCVHENQIEWYENQLALLTEQNNGVTPKSMMFMHIPVIEMSDAYNEYKENGFKDTENVKYITGKIGEKNSVICNSPENNGLFEACRKSGSTQAMFFGHDHLNSFAVNYKGVDMIYGYSIDYLAYPGIAKYGVQRGCTMVTINTDGSYSFIQENYYQDKYQSPKAKEEVTFEDMYEVEAK